MNKVKKIIFKDINCLLNKYIEFTEKLFHERVV